MPASVRHSRSPVEKTACEEMGRDPKRGTTSQDAIHRRIEPSQNASVERQKDSYLFSFELKDVLRPSFSGSSMSNALILRNMVLT